MNQRYPLIEGFGYFISIISVALLGMAAWLTAEGRPILFFFFFFFFFCVSRSLRAQRSRCWHDLALVCLGGAGMAGGSIANDRRIEAAQAT